MLFRSGSADYGFVVVRVFGFATCDSHRIARAQVRGKLSWILRDQYSEAFGGFRIALNSYPLLMIRLYESRVAGLSGHRMDAMPAGRRCNGELGDLSTSGQVRFAYNLAIEVHRHALRLAGKISYREMKLHRPSLVAGRRPNMLSRVTSGKKSAQYQRKRGAPSRDCGARAEH